MASNAQTRYAMADALYDLTSKEVNRRIALLGEPDLDDSAAVDAWQEQIEAIEAELNWAAISKHHKQVTAELIAWARETIELAYPDRAAELEPAWTSTMLHIRLQVIDLSMRLHAA